MRPRKPPWSAIGTITRMGWTTLPLERSAIALAMAGIRSSMRSRLRTAPSSRITGGTSGLALAHPRPPGDRDALRLQVVDGALHVRHLEGHHAVSQVLVRRRRRDRAPVVGHQLHRRASEPQVHEVEWHAQRRAIDPVAGLDLEPQDVGVELHAPVELISHDLDVIDLLEHGPLLQRSSVGLRPEGNHFEVMAEPPPAPAAHATAAGPRGHPPRRRATSWRPCLPAMSSAVSPSPVRSDRSAPRSRRNRTSA